MQLRLSRGRRRGRGREEGHGDQCREGDSDVEMKQESPLDGVAPDHREVGQGRPRGGEGADGSKRSIGRDVRNP